MGRRLVPCAGCHRHVTDEETACPFCGRAALTRRALGVAVASASILSAVGCEDKPIAPDRLRAEYGAPPPPKDTAATPSVTASVSDAPEPAPPASASVAPSAAGTVPEPTNAPPPPPAPLPKPVKKPPAPPSPRHNYRPEYGLAPPPRMPDDEFL